MLVAAGEMLAAFKHSWIALWVAVAAGIWMLSSASLTVNHFDEEAASQCSSKHRALNMCELD
jgi:hypothetical protein